MVIAYATEKQAYFDLFLESCRRYRIAPLILGWGEPWEGTCKKLHRICEYIEELPSNEMVLSVDPFDVIFLSGLEEIETKFRAQESHFLCGALRLKSFNAKVYDYEFNRTGLPYPENPGGYNFLNAGTWVSTAGYAYELLSSMAECGQLRASDMDQEVFTAQYIKDRTVIGVDWKCQLFQNILFRDFISRRPDLTDIRFTEGRIQVHSTGTLPSILHASGNLLMKEIASSLGYPKHLAIPKKDVKNYSRKAAFHLGQILACSTRPIRSSLFSAHVRQAESSADGSI